MSATRDYQACSNEKEGVPRRAEVGDLAADVGLGGDGDDEEVLGLDIAMQHSVLVQEGDGLGHVQRELQHQHVIEVAVAEHQICHRTFKMMTKKEGKIIIIIITKGS